MLALGGCQILGVKEQKAVLEKLPLIEGSVDLEAPGDGPIVVVLARRKDFTGVCNDDFDVVDHFVLTQPGQFVFGMAPGSYLVGAWHDSSRDLNVDPDEPVLRLCGSREYQLVRGEMISDIRLLIPAEPLGGAESFSILALEKQYQDRNQELVTFRQLIVYGDVVPLSDDRFDPANGSKGLWRPADFLVDVRPGVYMLQEFDAARIPVLFVHGISGHPREFEYLIDQLVQDRFQPWVFFYPSGLNLTGLASALVSILREMRIEHGFDELVVVAHSMGGLVSRSFLLQQAELSPNRYIPLFVSISSPFGGMASAQSGADGPVELPDSITDIATESLFLANLFYLDPEVREAVRPLPEGLSHHMIFGFQRNSRRLGESSDKTVVVASQLRPEAQLQASSIYGVDADHTGILRAPATAARLNALLGERHD